MRILTMFLRNVDCLRHVCCGVFWCALMLIGLMPGSSYADTTVGGNIAIDAEWTAAKSPYIVDSDITITDGAVLTIEPGTVVYMNAGVSLVVNNGSLRAKGVANAPIVITSSNDVGNGSPAPGNWGRIIFQDKTSDANTIFEWAQIRYGSGLYIESASPTLNYLTIQNHAGPAISMDLKSSPVGVGLSAAGNTVNGINVPAGEILGSANWQLRGIPYVLAEGELSVGKQPVITGITPGSIQQGTTIDAVITGTRLAGVESVNFGSTGITATLGSGATDTAIPLTITAGSDQPLGNVTFEAQTAAGRVRFDTGITVIPLKPTIGISSISPATLRRGESKAFQIVGSSLQGAQISPRAGSGLSVSNVVTTDTQATFNLAASMAASLGQQVLTLTNPEIANSATAIVNVEPALPKIYTSPSTLATPPNGAPYSFALVLTNSDNIAHTVNLSTGDPTIATVSPASITIPAGATQVAISVTGLKLGTTVLSMTSTTLATFSIQLYVTNDLNGALVGPVLSAAVGVNRTIDTSTLPAGMSLGPVVSQAVGVDRVSDSSALPVGAVLGPILSSPVGVSRPIDSSSLPTGAVLGPVLSPVVGVEN